MSYIERIQGIVKEYVDQGNLDPRLRMRSPDGPYAARDGHRRLPM